MSQPLLHVPPTLRNLGDHRKTLRLLINEPVEDPVQLPQTMEIIPSDRACLYGMAASCRLLQPRCFLSLH